MLYANEGLKSTYNNILKELPSNITLDVQEDIAADVVLSIIENGMPANLMSLIETFTTKNVTLYIKPHDTISMELLRRNQFGENKVTHILDESTEVAFEDRYYIEID